MMSPCLCLWKTLERQSTPLLCMYRHIIWTINSCSNLSSAVPMSPMVLYDPTLSTTNTNAGRSTDRKKSLLRSISSCLAYSWALRRHVKWRRKLKIITTTLNYKIISPTVSLHDIAALEVHKCIPQLLWSRRMHCMSISNRAVCKETFFITTGRVRIALLFWCLLSPNEDIERGWGPRMLWHAAMEVMNKYLWSRYSDVSPEVALTFVQLSASTTSKIQKMRKPNKQNTQPATSCNLQPATRWHCVWSMYLILLWG